MLRTLAAAVALALASLMFPSMAANAETLAHRIDRLAPHFTVVRPDGEGPFPVVIMLHGCGGPRPMMPRWAEAMSEAGAATILVDSFAHRGISRIAALSTVCTGAQLHGRERAGDLYAAYAWARAQPWADASRITAAGWSHGGWTVIDALALRPGEEMARATGLEDLPAEPLDGLAGAFLLYPYAGVASLAGRREWRLAPQSLAIVSGRDYIVGSRTPLRALERQVSRGAPIEIVVFETSTHAFDDETAMHPQTRFDPEATTRAQMLLRALVERANAPPQPVR